MARPAGTGFEIPPDVDLGDGLSEREAVALALWNSAGFRAALTELDAVRADVQQAGLLSNPTLTMQYPIGPKQFEGTLGWAIEALFTRSPRVAAERHRWEAVADRLVEAGLEHVRRVRSAFIDVWFATELARIAETRASLSKRLATIAGSRSRAGELNELQAAIFEANAVLDREGAADASQDRAIAWSRLAEQIGWEGSLDALTLGEPRPLPRVPEIEHLRLLAAARPELRAAEEDVSAAAERLNWEKRDIVRLTAYLDANDRSTGGFEVGPGLGIELPLFDRNQAGIARADSEVARAAWDYVGVRRRILAEVNRSHGAFVHADRTLRRWRSEALPALERSASLVREAAQRGAISYTDVTDSERRLLDARLRELELEARLRRSIVELERSVGDRLDE